MSPARQTEQGHALSLSNPAPGPVRGLNLHLSSAPVDANILANEPLLARRVLFGLLLAGWLLNCYWMVLIGNGTVRALSRRPTAAKAD